MYRTLTLLLLTLTTTLTQAEATQPLKRLTNLEVIEHIRSELPKEKAPRKNSRSLSMFESLDRNHDNEISLTEMRQHPSLASSFHRLDINNDGVLNQQEIEPLQAEAKGLRHILNLSALRII
ncbi:hypothetical protein Q4488_02275 [Amphritea sp. 1_MG-2023]|uniref:hypothetical protein n=1 Tax=Amphritea sp. 1_MG-2023 TaxID=3062670 RepID=UPI0026E35978|nr:hypothetical protein [Amphritea sp. 1_MG-2023]MDO6562198.1 hypothetical protein [Amphritea sp. 1_MG-2023]